MPIIDSNYRPGMLFRNGHLQTIFASMFRKLEQPNYSRERIDTKDNDFIDLDWEIIGSEKLIIISHGLEGDTYRPYVAGMVKIFKENGYDVLAWNFRSCSGEINKVLKFYHSGSSDDLAFVIQHVLHRKNYKSISLIGFSMGGNVTLKYLGENDNTIDRAVVISVPCDLGASSIELSKSKNWIYMKRFLLKLERKLIEKNNLYPNDISLEGFDNIKSFKEYDNRYTAPVHGFKDAEDYYNKCSSFNVLENIKIPVLIINSIDDPFLAGNCYPVDKAEKSENIYLEMPKHGGHVGFIKSDEGSFYWSEKRALEFISNYKKVK